MRQERSGEAKPVAAGLVVAEGAPVYGTARDRRWGTDGGLSASELDRLVDRISDRFRDRGVTRADVAEAVRWARGLDAHASIGRLRGAIAVGPGNVQEDVRRARALRGTPHESER